MTFPLSVGATTVLWPPRPSPDSVVEIMRKHRPTIFYGVPSLYMALLSHPDIGKGAGFDRLRAFDAAQFFNDDMIRPGCRTTYLARKAG